MSIVGYRSSPGDIYMLYLSKEIEVHIHDGLVLGFIIDDRISDKKCEKFVKTAPMSINKLPSGIPFGFTITFCKVYIRADAHGTYYYHTMPYHTRVC